jgi:hypothetical protein
LPTRSPAPAAAVHLHASRALAPLPINAHLALLANTFTTALATQLVLLAHCLKLSTASLCACLVVRLVIMAPLASRARVFTVPALMV